ncbi:MAG: HpcH/HpaI aldolase/citrate lyase family protein [Pseudomonadales bacterium]
MNNFRQRLLSGERLIGSFVKTPSMMIAEVLAQTDLDVLCIDAEHSPFERGDIDASLLAYRASNKPALVRVASGQPHLILNALDCGATGIVVPHVDSVEKAQACARAARFGDGGRGYAGSTRAAAYGGNSVASNLEHNRENTTVIAQIEDLAALECIDDIAAVNGIDCLFIGTMDLTVALGASQAKDPRVIEATEMVCLAAEKAGRRTGIFVPSIDDIPFWLERGVSFFLMSSDHAFIKQGAAALVNGCQQAFNR